MYACFTCIPDNSTEKVDTVVRHPQNPVAMPTRTSWTHLLEEYICCSVKTPPSSHAPATLTQKVPSLNPGMRELRGAKCQRQYVPKPASNTEKAMSHLFNKTPTAAVVMEHSTSQTHTLNTD